MSKKRKITYICEKVFILSFIFFGKKNFLKEAITILNFLKIKKRIKFELALTKAFKKLKYSFLFQFFKKFFLLFQRENT